jgi:hypothetical protein
MDDGVVSRRHAVFFATRDSSRSIRAVSTRSRREDTAVISPCNDLDAEVLGEGWQIIRPGSNNNVVALGSVPISHLVQAQFGIHVITSEVGMGQPGLQAARTRIAKKLMMTADR